MSIEALKLFRPQEGDIVIVDFNKVNVTQVENAVKDMNVAVIAVHDINTIQIWGMREQKDFSQEVEELKVEVERLNNIIKNNITVKSNAGGVPIPQTTSSALPSVSKTT